MKKINVIKIISTMFKPQQWLEVSLSCDWMCLGCPLPLRDKDALHIQKQIDCLSSFGVVNIYGGNPLMYSHWSKLIPFLYHKKQLQIQVWTHCADSIDTYLAVSDYVKKWFIYVPTVLPDTFEEFVGSLDYATFKAHLEHLKDSNVPFELVHFVTPYTLSLLPDVYELSFSLGVSLILVYTNSIVKKEEIRYIKRFFHVKNVSVYRTNHDVRNCLGAPKDAFTWYQKIKNDIYEALNGIRFKYKL